MELAENPQFWQTAAGELIALADMETSHLWNTTKMLYNHLAECYFLPTIGSSKGYTDFEQIANEDPERLVRAIYALATELKKRSDGGHLTQGLHSIEYYLRTSKLKLKAPNR